MDKKYNFDTLLESTIKMVESNSETQRHPKKEYKGFGRLNKSEVLIARKEANKHKNPLKRQILQLENEESLALPQELVSELEVAIEAPEAATELEVDESNQEIDKTLELISDSIVAVDSSQYKFKSYEKLTLEIKNHFAQKLQELESIESKFEYLINKRDDFPNLLDQLLDESELVQNQLLSEYTPELIKALENLTENTESQVMDWIYTELEKITTEISKQDSLENKKIDYQKEFSTIIEKAGLEFKNKLDATQIAFFKNNPVDLESAKLLFEHIAAIKNLPELAGRDITKADVRSKLLSSKIDDSSRFSITKFKEFSGNSRFEKVAYSLEVKITSANRICLSFDGNKIEILQLGVPTWH